MEAAKSPALTPEEAKQLHYEALIIDYNPPATTGLLFTDAMREALDEWAGYGMTRGEATERLSAMAVREVQTSAEARATYLGILDEAGVDIANATYGALPPRLADIFEKTVTRVAEPGRSSTPSTASWSCARATGTFAVCGKRGSTASSSISRTRCPSAPSSTVSRCSTTWDCASCS